MTGALSPEDAAAVLRRAAELDTTPLDQQDELDESVVRAAAREVGLSDPAVDRAVVEWRAGALEPLPELLPDRRLGLLATTAVERLVPVPVDEVGPRLEAWLYAQWFERRRVHGSESEWAPRPGVLASARRMADVQRRLRLSPVRRLRLCVAPAARGSRVRLIADLGEHRNGLVAGWVATPALVVGLGVAVVTGLPGDALPEVLLAGPAAAAVGSAGWLRARRAMDVTRAEVDEELERTLDDLVSPTARPPSRLPAWAAGWLPRPG